jgi:NAD+ kinase
MEEIRLSLERDGVAVSVCAFEGKPEIPPTGDFDLAFSLGGDGTVLYAARCMAGRGVPVLPINLGTLGFIAAVQREEWRSVYDGWARGAIGVSERVMLEVSVERSGKELLRQTCLNDAVVSASGIAKIIRLEVGTEKVRIGRYRADGLIVATPTGSTAYSVAAGGPILDPEMDAMILNPICPFTLSNRPIVIPSHETIIIQVEAEQRSGVLLTVDGQIVVPLEPADRISVRRAGRKALLVASDRNLFYRVLRTKLNWSGGPDA